MASASPEFLEWRHQFLLRRITLLCWVMLGIISIFGILLFAVAIPSLNATGDPALTIGRTRMMWTVIVIVGQWLGLLMMLVFLNRPASTIPIACF